jgi:hypothetical protein
LFLSEVCWKSGVPIEGEQATISGPVVTRAPRRNVIQCCGHGVLQSEKEL